MAENIDMKEYIPEARRTLDQIGMAYEAAADTDVTYEVIEKINCAWIKTSDADKDSIILHLHGGSYFQGSIQSHQNFSSQITANTKINILLPEYGLAPEKPFPQGLNDAFKIYQFLLTKFQNIILLGDSAGGGLALSLIHKLKAGNVNLPKVCIAIFPSVDLREVSIQEGYNHVGLGDSPDVAILNELLDLYCMDESKENPLISPIFGELEGFPPTFVQVGTKDFLYTQNQAFLQKAQKTKNLEVELDVYEEMVHGFHIFPDFAEQAAVAYENIAKFINKHLY